MSKLQIIINPGEADELRIPLYICEGDLEEHYGDKPLPADKWKLRSMIYVVAKNMAVTRMVCEGIESKQKTPWMLVDFGMDKFVVAAKGCEDLGYKEGYYLP